MTHILLNKYTTPSISIPEHFDKRGCWFIVIESPTHESTTHLSLFEYFITLDAQVLTSSAMKFLPYNSYKL